MRDYFVAWRDPTKSLRFECAIVPPELRSSSGVAQADKPPPDQFLARDRARDRPQTEVSTNTDAVAKSPKRGIRRRFASRPSTRLRTITDFRSVNLGNGCLLNHGNAPSLKQASVHTGRLDGTGRAPSSTRARRLRMDSQRRRVTRFSPLRFSWPAPGGYLVPGTGLEPASC